MASHKTEMSEYRKSLQALEQQMQSQYDKSVMALSGGALGLSLSFLKEIVGKKGIVSGGYLLAAWCCWGASVACILASFYTSVLAMQHAVKQVDDDSIYTALETGRFDLLTKVLNITAGLLFVVGVIALVLFVHRNLL
ncbi:MAG: hypothetical protein NT167_24920 [Verrucomicrobia bacterium]|nr:hypothetical protein [Verrucomicrobiota bacterium]